MLVPWYKNKRILIFFSKCIIFSKCVATILVQNPTIHNRVNNIYHIFTKRTFNYSTITDQTVTPFRYLNITNALQILENIRPRFIFAPFAPIVGGRTLS